MFLLSQDFQLINPPILTRDISGYFSGSLKLQFNKDKGKGVCYANTSIDSKISESGAHAALVLIRQSWDGVIV